MSLISEGDLLPQDQMFRLQLALDLKSEARTPKISISSSVIRARAYPVCSLRLRRIEFSVHTGIAMVGPDEVPVQGVTNLWVDHKQAAEVERRAVEADPD